MIDFVGLINLMAAISVLCASAAIMLAPIVAAIMTGEWRWILAYLAYAVIMSPIAYIITRDAADEPDFDEDAPHIEYQEDGTDADSKTEC